MRAIWHIARADFLERVRRYSFLVMLAAVLWLAYLTITGTVGVAVAGYRGIFNSAWSGAVMTMMVSTFLSIAGFYVVKNCIRRDEETRVGQIIAATPVRKFNYLVGKALSSTLVLSAMIGVLAVAGVFLQMWQGEDRHFELWKYIAPFLIVALPAMFFTACVAIFFECTPGLRGGFGNVAYFFTWGMVLGAVINNKCQDVGGLVLFQNDIVAALLRVHPDAKPSFMVGGGSERMHLPTFVWEGMHWTAVAFVSRVVWIGIALALVALASLLFHRFDPQRMKLRVPRLGWNPFRRKFARVEESESFAIVPTHLTPLPQLAPRFRFAQVVASELRLMLKGLPWGWWLVLGGLWVAAAANEAKDARMFALGLVWIWPVLLWSKMGTREARFGTGPLVFSSAHSISRQFPAAWVAGFLVAVFTGAPAAIRMAVAGDRNGLLCWLVAALFIPSMALACGVWSGSSKLFEALYSILWYVGPMHATAPVDFIGVTPGSARPLLYLGLTAALLVAAFARRGMQLKQGKLAFAA